MPPRADGFEGRASRDGFEEKPLGTQILGVASRWAQQGQLCALSSSGLKEPKNKINHAAPVYREDRMLTLQTQMSSSLSFGRRPVNAHPADSPAHSGGDSGSQE